jgi:hypothetical protein
MKLDFPYKEGDLVNIYKNFETEEELIGTVRLVKLHKPGRSFILEEIMPESEQIVYNYQEWLVEWSMPDKFTKRSIEKIRYIDTIGIANSSVDEEYDLEVDKLPHDSFLKFNGIEIY